MIKIGTQFAEERRSQGLTLEQVSKATKIREEFLSAIERGDFKALPSSTYAHGFVRNYAKFLGLPTEKSLAIFRREFDEKKNIQVLPRGFSNPREFSVHRFKIGRSVILAVFFFIVVGGFLLFQYRSAIFSPSLSVMTPFENQTLSYLTFEVRGKTDPDVALTINDEQVSLDANGNFKKKITVFPGDSSINFKAENRFGKVTVLKRDIKVTPGY
jgi:cytoskeletal protein RodZ